MLATLLKSRCGRGHLQCTEEKDAGEVKLSLPAELEHLNDRQREQEDHQVKGDVDD